MGVYLVGFLASVVNTPLTIKVNILPGVVPAIDVEVVIGAIPPKTFAENGTLITPEVKASIGTVMKLVSVFLKPTPVAIVTPFTVNSAVVEFGIKLITLT